LLSDSNTVSISFIYYRRIKNNLVLYNILFIGFDEIGDFIGDFQFAPQDKAFRIKNDCSPPAQWSVSGLVLQGGNFFERNVRLLDVPFELHH
jgi:hypothetical protein